MTSRMALHVLVFPSMFFILCCQDMGVEIAEGGPGVIVPGLSVEGIRLGDTRETVEAKLGRPTSVGWADGLYRGWRLYSYEEGSRFQPNVKIQFFFLDDGNDYGPVDEIGIGPAYEGKTKEGVGIGSMLEKVHLVYGPPATTLSWPDQHTIADKYCQNGKKFEVHYKDSLVSVMSIGYFVPIPQDDPCK